MITIVDYGIGNLGSIFNMFKRIGVKSEITADIENIRASKKILLPGVGAFDTAMTRINDTPGLREVLTQKALVEKVPFLGICLGMQLLTDSSEEGIIPGLGWIPAKTQKFVFNDPSLKIPHMGWNIVRPEVKSQLTHALPENSRFYFVHSYNVQVYNQQNSILKCRYGIEFDAAIQHENIFGAQFHPEKSHKFGMKLLENFGKI